MKFEKYANDDLNLVLDVRNRENYILRDDNVIIGYGSIIENTNNEIEIFIFPEYRGNGYGKQLFNNLIKAINNRNIVKIKFDNINIIAKRIVEKVGGKQESLIDGVVSYIIPLNNN